MTYSFCDDLRSQIERLGEKNWLSKVKGADWNLEIGTICELNAERHGPPILFEKIKGYSEEYRLLANAIANELKTFKISLGIPEDQSLLEMMNNFYQAWRNFKPVPPVEVKSAPILENVLAGDDIDMFKFPAPKWNMRDGGRYIGTGGVNIARDPDRGWLNAGVHRVMIHDKKTLSNYLAPGKDFNVIRAEYWQRGEACPVVMCFGPEPAVYLTAILPVPWGISELDLAGYFKGKPVEVIKGDVTGLPIPATAEIAIEGFIPPLEVEQKMEGPFGEWTGHSAVAKIEPVVHVEKLYHRNNPILNGTALNRTDCGLSAFPMFIPLLRARLEGAGIVGIKGMWGHGRAGIPMVVISIKQQYVGHAWEVGIAASALMRGGSASGRYTIVVDDDIDPSDWEQVLWAMCFRVDPETQVHILPPLRDSKPDPILAPEKRARQDITTSRVIINACRPFHWMKDFPPVVTASPELRKQVMDKFGHLFK